MHEIKLACYTNPWGKNGFVQAIKDIAECGFAGVEYSAQVVADYVDRLRVFQEIINTAGLQIVNLIQDIDLLDKENADLQVERGVAAARFISATGAPWLTICHEHVRVTPISDEEWTVACATLEEIAERSFNEHGLTVCYMPRNSRLVFHEKDICRLLAATNEKYVKLALDTAEITLAGSTPKKIIKDAFSRIGIVRFHDVSASKRRAKFTRDDGSGGAPQFGRGAVNFDEIGQLLEKNNFRGWISVDVSGDPHPPMESISAAYKYLARRTSILD